MVNPGNLNKSFIGVKYLYKYVTKGNDRVTFTIDGVQQDNAARNEIKEYKDGRYPARLLLGRYFFRLRIL
jgi:hypothetical protein